MPATHSGPDLVSETVLPISDDDRLVAVMSRPARLGARPGVIILNAGVLHRVGPHRLHVTLARRLAARGLPALRIDLAGVGDSPGRGDGGSFRASAVADTRAAMTAITAATGCDRFILFGLCSGADNGLATAAVDPRVVGLVVLDPPTYATRRATARKLAGRLRGGALGPLLRSAGRRLATRVAAPAPGEAPELTQGREFPPLAEHAAQLTALVERGVAILAVYSGVNGVRYNHGDQLFEWVPALRGQVEIAYFPDSNHSFTLRAAQAELLDHVTSWVERRFR